MKTISLSSAENVITAVGYADQRGHPLNRHLTISWYVAGLPGRVLDAQREILQLASKWLKYRGVTPAYVWAIENSPRFRDHSHIYIHVPRHLAGKFRKMVNRWVKGVGGDPRLRGAIRMTRDKHDRGNVHAASRDLVRYLLKGIDNKAGQLLNIDRDYEKAGVITGKRCGTSQSLSRKARGV